MVDFCFQTDELRGDTKKLQDAAVAINNPVPWSRKRPDGYELKWLLSLATGSHRGVAPFLIEDVTPRIERIPQQFVHANQTAGIEKLIVAVGELGQIGKWYGALLGVKGEPFADSTLGADGLRFQAGPHTLDFVSPRQAHSPLVHWLREFGPSPYAAVLKSARDGVETLESGLTHGAQFLIRGNLPR
jgi:hypothetical protein